VTTKIVQHWCQEFREKYGHELPDDYLVIDLETTGGSRAYDLPVEFGFCLVRDGEVKENMGVLFDWTRHKRVDQYELKKKLRRMADIMAKQDKAWHITYSRLRTEGLRPERAFEFAFDLIEACRKQEMYFIGHNFIKFDEDFLHHGFRNFIGRGGFYFGENEVFDTGAIFKASKMDRPILPSQYETMKAYFRRVCNARAKTPWGLENACVPAYNLDEKYALDMRNAHGAAFDSYVTHLLFQEMKHLNGEPDSSD